MSQSLTDYPVALGLFTQRARKVLELAQEEARRFNHNYVGTELLLLGLIRETEGPAARVLRVMGVDHHRVRERVKYIIGHGEGITTPPGTIAFTPRSKKVIDLALDEARRLGDDYIGTEHLLLGLLQEGESTAAGVLEGLLVSIERVRAEVAILNQETVSTAKLPVLTDLELDEAKRSYESRLAQLDSKRSELSTTLDKIRAEMELRSKEE